MVFKDVLQVVGGYKTDRLVILSKVLHAAGLSVIDKETIAVGANPDAVVAVVDKPEAATGILQRQLLIIYMRKLIGLLRCDVPKLIAIMVEYNLISSVVDHYLSIVDMNFGVWCQGATADVVAVSCTLGAENQLVVLQSYALDLMG